jgi:GTP cyclohydrolase II
MSTAQSPSTSALFGSWEYISVSRALAELQALRPVRINAFGEALFVLPVEGLDDRRLAEFVSLCRPEIPHLIITKQRALAIGANGAATPLVLQLPEALVSKDVLELVAARRSRIVANTKVAGFAAAAAIQLIKLSHGLPAVLAANMAHHGIDPDHSIVAVHAKAVGHFAADAVKSLSVASDAVVPLASGVAARFIVFRDATGTDQVAIIVGKPDYTKPVAVRLHSACLTGDVFGSRRCDCGDQLALALTRLEDLGGGVILYLAQEGRGLGLANKMRAYRLQDEGLDTLDANTTLGFDDDERDYGVAARMLQMLNCSRILLLTNNPAKLDGLTQAGIEISARVPLEAPINPHNRRYLSTKAARSGHQLFNLKTLTAENS